MTKKEEKPESSSFSDSAEMFDTLFRLEINKEKQGEEQPETEEEPLSDTEELFLSAFKEENKPEKVTAPKDEGPVKARPQPPAKPPIPAGPPAPKAPPPGASPSPAPGKVAAPAPRKAPPQPPAKPPVPVGPPSPKAPPPGASPSPAPGKEALPPPKKAPPQAPAKPPIPPAPPQVQAPEVPPSPGTGKSTPAPQENKASPPRVPRSVRKPLRVIVPVLGVLVLAGLALFAFGVPDFFSERGKPPPSVPTAKKVVPPPSPLPKPEVKEETRPPAPPPKAESKAEPRPPSAPSETEIKEEPGRPSVPPKSEVKEGPRPQPSAPPTIEKPEIREPEIPKERPAAEGAVKKADTAAPAQDVSPPKGTSLPYSIYLGSYKDLQSVQKAGSFCREIGLSPYWFPIDLGEKGTWYRVFAGCFESREAAEALIKEKRVPDASAKQTPHAALAGTYRSPEELDEATSRLKNLGYGPYVIRRPDGSSHLFVGAFFQKLQAEALVAELAKKGIASKPAER
jgi:hypothetical protein